MDELDKRAMFSDHPDSRIFGASGFAGCLSCGCEQLGQVGGSGDGGCTCDQCRQPCGSYVWQNRESSWPVRRCFGCIVPIRVIPP